MGLLDKFEAIEIKNNTRLSDEDRLYCEQQQKLYSKVLKHYRIMFAELLFIKAKDNDFYSNVGAENECNSGGYTYKIYEHKFTEAKKDEFVETIKGVHNRFIEQINSYFRNKYNVKIDEKGFDKYFTKECPKHPDRGYYGYSRMSDEEIEKYKEEVRQYEIENYFDSVINAEIEFNSVIDDIFLILGGFSFSEKVEQEIKENAKNAALNSNVGSTIVTHFKYFKNGKWEVTFDSHSNALKFAREFLGYTE